jgi:glyoxylase-like metal-dependent hydrolase (beta-lactamase superfamily II)
MIHDWAVVTIGNLSRNRYWDDNEAQPVRPTLCTCALIRCDGGNVLVDPSCEQAERMAAELERTTGLKVADVTAVVLTHEHRDHHYGLRHFPEADWVAAPEVAAAVNASSEYGRLVQPVTGRLLDCLDLVPTPGHTPGHHSLRFDCDGLSVVVAGDAVMTKDFWRERRPYFNATDVSIARQSMEDLAGMAQAIIPGHANWFVTGR